ncbi:MAG: phenylacetate--CoA ligase family protein [Elusimicrobia bacterium]|nr:phenylacetate--CoA ligase family protein [Elusimicrobiota bacterium]
MSVEFRFSDFFYPASLLKLRYAFERNQWRSTADLKAYQDERLRAIVQHAAARVPYYRELFRRLGISPADIRTASDLRRLPILAKSTLRSRVLAFRSDDFSAYHPMAMSTSGSSGRRLNFLLDRKTNVLEFAYYWRHWGCAGYRLGDPFAEFSTTFFLKPENAEHGFAYKQVGTGRLLLNSLYLSPRNVDALCEQMKRHRARFLKALPSVAYAFVRLLASRGLRPPHLDGVFSTGEVLFPHQRRAIETAFGCRVLESYGHMERVIAASECPRGHLHVNSDYGLLELGAPLPRAAGCRLRRAPILGTTLYNFSMPLIRYDTGDVAEYDERQGPCACGRGFPVLGRVEGRQEDAIVTPDGRIVTTLFLAFDQVPGIQMGRIVQEAPDLLVAQAVKTPSAPRGSEQLLCRVLRKFVGPSMRIQLDFVDREEDLWNPARKDRVVHSKVQVPMAA